MTLRNATYTLAVMEATIARKLELVQGDITGVRADAIVNAANSTLLGGGGVDGRIHAVAGPGLLAECRTLGGCPTGSARITKAYQLPARFVIHAVGPVYRGGTSGESELLAGCYRTALQLAADHGIKSIAFPAISCGAYGYPIESAARVAVEAVERFLGEDPRLDRVLFVLYDQPAYDVYRRLLTGAAGAMQKEST